MPCSSAVSPQPAASWKQAKLFDIPRAGELFSLKVNVQPNQTRILAHHIAEKLDRPARHLPPASPMSKAAATSC